MAELVFLPLKINKQEAIVLAVHALLLREGFSCIAVEEQNGKGPKGFAPPVRVVPESKLVPPRWNADTGACTFQYRHNTKPGKEFQVMMMMIFAFLIASHPRFLAFVFP